MEQERVVGWVVRWRLKDEVDWVGGVTGGLLCGEVLDVEFGRVVVVL